MSPELLKYLLIVQKASNRNHIFFHLMLDPLDHLHIQDLEMMQKKVGAILNLFSYRQRMGHTHWQNLVVNRCLSQVMR